MGTEGQGLDNSLIYRLLTKWFPDWEAPAHRKEWNICLCPFHDESRPSASVNYRAQAFVCRACDWKGDAIALIKRKEECSFADAKRYAEEISGREYKTVSPKPTGKPRRGISEAKRNRW